MSVPSLSPQGRFRDTMPNARTLRMTGIKTQASIAAATFHQPSLIQLPPHLQAVFEACVAEVRSERGTNV
jgi:hypothetical protein